jgi:transposase InsO family protein
LRGWSHGQARTVLAGAPLRGERVTARASWPPRPSVASHSLGLGRHHHPPSIWTPSPCPSTILRQRGAQARVNTDPLRRPLEPEQYLSLTYTERLAEAGIAPSVGSRGDSYDNALAESVIGLLKTEVIRRRGPWRHLEDVEFATLEWVAWFNTRRLLEPIGHVPPVEYEAAYYDRQETPAALGALN